MNKLIAVPGLLILLLGTYVAGGNEVTCTRVGAPPTQAESPDSTTPQKIVSCRVRTTRWFGRKVMEERTYARVTGVGSIAIASPSSSSSGTTSSWYLQLLSDGREIEKVSGNSDQIFAAEKQFAAWYAGDLRRPRSLDLTDWRFAYAAVAFGSLWLLIAIAVIRKAAEDFALTAE
jgi:hypothetical protein